MFQTSTVLSKATSIVCRERRWLFRACVVDRYCTRMGYTIAFLFSLLFQLIPNKFWSSLLLEHLVSCSCFRVLIVSCGFIDGQIEHRTFYGSGIFALFSSQKVPSRRIWEALPTHRITPHGTLFMHWKFACAVCSRIDGNRVDVFILPIGDTLTFVS